MTNSVGITLVLLPRNALDFNRFTRPKILKQKFHMHMWKKYVYLLPSLLTQSDFRWAWDEYRYCGRRDCIRSQQLGGGGVHINFDFWLVFWVAKQLLK